jgi:hypothetical protein
VAIHHLDHATEQTEEIWKVDFEGPKPILQGILHRQRSLARLEGNLRICRNGNHPEKGRMAVKPARARRPTWISYDSIRRLLIWQFLPPPRDRDNPGDAKKYNKTHISPLPNDHANGHDRSN